MPVHDVPGDAQVLTGLADRTALELGIHGDRGVRYVSALLDNDLLRTVDVEHVLDELRGNPNRWHFIEVMNCPGGCVNGGGQPVQGTGTGWLKPLFPLPVSL